MHIRRCLSLFLVALLLFGMVALMPVARAEALDFSLMIAKLNKWQYYFSRTIMSIALKDSYDARIETGKNIFPSLTCGQACFEGGICGAPISVIGKNQYAIRAYSYWDGKVYDDDELVVYDSYSDAVNIKGQDYVDSVALWRAYDTWEESIHDHSQMFLTKSQYAEVVAATNYLDAAQAIEDAKYNGAKATYKDNLLKRVEGYGFVQLDSVCEDENGIFGLTMSEANIRIDSGETYQLAAYSYPKTAYDCSSEIVWESLDPAVATVDQNGVVTGVANGYALITANYGTKETCCIVCVDTNAYVMYGNYAVYSAPDTDADSLGKVSKGQPVYLHGSEQYLSPDGEEYVRITARLSNGKTITGYILEKRIHYSVPSRASITTPFTAIRLDEGDEQQIPLTVHAEELKDAVISWTSSNEDVAEISQDGHLAAVSEGVAVISIFAGGQRARTIPVYVGEPELQMLYTVHANYLRVNPVSDKGDNVYGTIRAGDYVWVLSVPAKGWYRVLAYVDGKYLDGYVKPSYFGDPPDPGPNDQTSYPSGSPVSNWSADPSTGEPDPASSEVSYTLPDTVTVSFRTGEVVVDDWLNVRTLPSSGADHIARLANKTPVIILETVDRPDEAIFKTWYLIRADHGESVIEGYVASDYIQFTGTTDIQMDDEPTNTALYPIDETTVSRIPEQTPVSTLAANLGRTIEVSRDGQILTETDVVATGDTVTFFIGRIRVYSRIAIVPGDVNGDGAISVTDYLLMKRYVLGTQTFSPIALRAGKVTGGEDLGASDYLRVKRVVLGTMVLF